MNRLRRGKRPDPLEDIEKPRKVLSLFGWSKKDDEGYNRRTDNTPSGKGKP